MTLTSAIFPTSSLLGRAVTVFLGTMFIAAASQINVPGYPVPATFQTLAILLVGFAFGARMGAVTVLAYLAEGAMGAPVFANFGNGAAFFGPTAGFLVGFVGLAYLAGLAADMGIKKALPLAVVGIVASALLYIPGVAWAMGADAVFGLDATKWGANDFASIWKWYMSPFLLGDLIKAVLAAMVVTGAWAALAKRAK